jgi:pimeloyl-ACP methyl ester carboxylesterase
MVETWQQRVGYQRDWVWRGWQTRYSFQRGKLPQQSLPPVLLVHGFGASIGHWEHNFAALATDRTVYAVDLVGWGGSRKPSVNYDIDLWVAQIHDFWQTFIGEPTILVGNSIGSLVALVAAARHPEMASSLVMVSLPDLSAEQEMIPKPLQPLVNGIKRAILSPMLLNSLFWLVSKPSVARRWAKIAYFNPDRVTDDLVALFLTPAREKDAPAAFVKIMQGMTSSNFSPNIRKLLPGMDLPMLLIWGAQDRMIPKGTAAILLSLNPLLKLVSLQASGHCAHHESPDEVNDIIGNWIEICVVESRNRVATELDPDATQWQTVRGFG